ncbi:MAG: serine hydrolase domain-containing protein, partial [Chitinophagales bacterium]
AGYVLLGLIVEALTGEPLDRFAARELFAPLGLADTGFLRVAQPLPAHLAERLVPTEVRRECDKGRSLLRQVEEASGWPEETLAAWRTRHDPEGRPRGVVHDENAAFLGGGAGNAGLFSTALDLVTYGQLWLEGGRLGEVRLFRPETVRLATRNWTPGLAESRGLGWQLPGGDNSFGDLLARESFGHTGFTGTGLWVDPVHRMVVVLLTDRLQLGRANERLFRTRKLILNSLVAALSEEA